MSKLVAVRSLISLWHKVGFCLSIGIISKILIFRSIANNNLTSNNIAIAIIASINVKPHYHIHGLRVRDSGGIDH